MKLIILIISFLCFLPLSAQKLSHDSNALGISYKIDGQEVRKDEYKQAINDDELLETFQKHNTNAIVGETFMYLSSGYFIYNTYEWIANGDFQWGLVGAGSAFYVVGYLFNKKASNLLNDIESRVNDDISLNIQGNEHGLGLSIRF